MEGSNNKSQQHCRKHRQKENNDPALGDRFFGAQSSQNHVSNKTFMVYKTVQETTKGRRFEIQRHPSAVARAGNSFKHLENTCCRHPVVIY
ncbi:hypothetical protein NPIL_132661 [Nephila pilipes]|uniref:Uncharacterized protein n=1 Tax=Nephila pilipes TaxID=299642 RepID=A0A8X6P420_NEPPI|nr:hypothetical protein NPIL_132661 [Nephila pilipes]